MANKKGSKKTTMSITVDYLTKKLCEESDDNISALVNNFLFSYFTINKEDKAEDVLKKEKEELSKEMANMSQRMTIIKSDLDKMKKDTQQKINEETQKKFAMAQAIKNSGILNNRRM